MYDSDKKEDEEEKEREKIEKGEKDKEKKRELGAENKKNIKKTRSSYSCPGPVINDMDKEEGKKWREVKE